MKKLLFILACLAAWPAYAGDDYTFYDANGRVAGRSTTDGRGTTLFYDANGRMSGNAITRPGQGSGTITTYYDANGRMVGVSRSK
jgi:YD repeat-containing protein